MSRNDRLFHLFGTVALSAALFAGGGFASAYTAAKQQDAQAKESITSVPKRVSAITVPAKIAFTNNGHLWIIDGSQPKAMPKQVTQKGSAEIVGWSYNGEWLLYLQISTQVANQSQALLWAVKADGTGAFQVEAQPISGKPKWSPVDLTVAYLTQTGKPVDAAKLTLTTIGKGKATSTHPSIDREPSDFAWMPDGKTLLVSTHAEKDRPIRIMKMDLSGKIKENYQIGGKPNVEEGIYFYQADGLTVSPNGHYVSFFVRPNSASLSADGVSIRLLDLQRPSKGVELGGGLGYPEWFAWSPDSSRLAFIEGAGREATANKELAIADTRANFRVMHAGEKGFVDSEPIWAKPDGSKLYYTHGKASTAWMGNNSPHVVMVPGQRIWELSADGKQQAVTQGTVQTADYYPEVSRDGKTLLFVRMDGAEHGSLYVKSAGAKQEVELLRHVTGDGGFYGNYLPEWISVYWNK